MGSVARVRTKWCSGYLFYWCKSTKTDVCWRVLTCADVSRAVAAGSLGVRHERGWAKETKDGCVFGHNVLVLVALVVVLKVIKWAGQGGWALPRNKGKGEHRFDGGRVVGMMSKVMRSGTGEKPLRHGHISPTYQPGVSRGVQEYKHIVAWQRKHNMAHGRKEHLVQHYKGRHDKGESQTHCGKSQCSMARKGREGGEAAGEGTQGLCV